MPQPIARWNPTRSLWETDRFDLLSEHSEPFWETWPTSGSMRSGSAYALPTSAPRTPGSGSSSSRRLPTPEAKLATSGVDSGRQSRGSGGDDLTTALDRLLPTPTVVDLGSRKTVAEWDEWTARMQREHGNGNGHGPSLAIEVLRLAEEA